MKIKQLHEYFLESQGVCTDTRKITKDCLFFALTGDNFDGNAFTDEALEKGAKYVVIDNDTYSKHKQTILVDNVLKTLQELATYHRNYLKTPIISLTGSNGKTTTKELISAILSTQYKTTATKGNLNNHIGVPLTLLSLTKETEIAVVEMGANHQKEIEFLCEVAKPDYGYITNFGKAHLEGFGSVEGVIKGKSELYDYLIKNKKPIFVNTNDAIQVKITMGKDIIPFGSGSTKIDLIEAKPFVKVAYNKHEITSKLIGNYNYTNIAAAIAIGAYFKVSFENIKSAIENYTPNNNRSQIINYGTSQIILDAYNANPSSIAVALEHFSKQKNRHKVVILGDMFELGADADKEHQAIVKLVNKLDIQKAIYIGEHFNRIAHTNANNTFYKSFLAFQEDFNFETLIDSDVLIKGSRGMALERIIALLDKQ